MATSHHRRAVLMTANPELRDAVRARLDNARLEDLGSASYLCGTFVAEHVTWDIWLLDIGSDSDDTTVATMLAVTQAEPQIVLLLGFAHGLRDISTGDVDAVTAVYDLEADDGIGARFFTPEEASFAIKELARQASDSIRAPGSHDAHGTKRFQSLLAPAVVSGKALAPNAADAATKSRSLYGEAVALDMRDSGFMKALRPYPWLNAMMLLGVVSQDATPKTRGPDPRTYELVATHVVEFAFTLLKLHNAPPIPVGAASGRVDNRAGPPDDVWSILERYVPHPPSEVGKPKPSAIQGVLATTSIIATWKLREPHADQHRAVYNRIKQWLVALTRADELTSRERLAVGLTLGLMGDPRRGAGVTAEMLPDIWWTDPYPAGLVGVGYGAPARIPLQSFRLSRFPVTQAQYQLFLDARGGYRSSRWWAYSDDARRWHERNPWPATARWDDANCPRVNISWFEAVAYCQWLSTKEGFGEVRLPTEAELEYATCKCPPRKYPWGDAFTGTEVNSREGRLERISAVGLYPKGRSSQGAEDLLGNVWEFCQTAWRAVPYADVGRERLGGAQVRVIHGGSWNTPMNDSALVVREGCDPSARTVEWGFRLCQPLA